jgi:hypothetical protein
MAVKFVARMMNGQVFKRTSASRVYAYCVVTLDDMEQEMGWADVIYPHDLSNFAYSKAMAEQGEYLSKRKGYPDMLLKARDEADRAKQAAEIAGCADAQAYAEKKRQERVAGVKAKQARGGYEVWGSVGWCSRLDLARKLAAKYRFVEILIAERA